MPMLAVTVTAWRPQDEGFAQGVDDLPGGRPASPRPACSGMFHDDREPVPARRHTVSIARALRGGRSATSFRARRRHRGPGGRLSPLEVVEIDIEQRALLRTGTAFQRVRQPIHEESAVGKPVNASSLALPPNLLARVLDSGDVGRDAHAVDACARHYRLTRATLRQVGNGAPSFRS